MGLRITIRAKKFLERLPGKDCRIVGNHIDRLVDHPYAHGDIKRLNTPKERYRMHVSDKYIVFFYPDGNSLVIDEILTSEQAHKRYGRI